MANLTDENSLDIVLDVKVKDFPTHAANLPVAMIPNCAATRHAHFTLDGSGPVMLEPPSLEDWPELTYDASKGKRVNLDATCTSQLKSFSWERDAALDRLYSGFKQPQCRVDEYVGGGVLYAIWPLYVNNEKSNRHPNLRCSQPQPSTLHHRKKHVGS